MSNATLVNFAAGETSPRSRGRFDLAWFQSSLEKCKNFIPEIAGPARYRPGFKHVRFTRAGATARLIRFQFNDSKSYMLEFTTGKMRAYLDGELITTTRTTITAITKASPAVITVASTTGLANGDEIIITDIVGMEELNGRQVKLAGASGSTFQLVDPITGDNINSTSFGTWISGGTVKKVDEIASPYLAADLDDISAAPSAVDGIMYLAHPRYAPRKLRVDASDHFTLATYSRTADPFAAGDAVNVADAGGTVLFHTKGPVTKLYFPPGTVIYESSLYLFAGVGGTTQLNGNSYYLEALSSGGGDVVVRLLSSTRADVDSTAWTAFTSGGTATPAAECPIAAAFHEGRLGFIGSNLRPNTMFLSRSPDDDGNPRYDDFTGGTDPDHACFFALSPASGEVDYASWAQGSEDYLFVGTYGGTFRISGGGLDEPITPSSINARKFDSFGCEAAAAVVAGSRIFFIQRGGRALRTIRYNADGKLETYDMLLNAKHFADSRLRRVVFLAGDPDALWAVREDGVLVGMTVQGAENVAGWHRHVLGGSTPLVLDAQGLPRTDRDDQLWIVAQRTLSGVTRCSVEILADDVVFPDPVDFYTAQGETARDANLETWKNVVYRRQEEYIHLDAAGTYNGADRGEAAAATLTPGAVEGDGITFTASAAVFKASDVGNELWKKPNRETGVGSGRATITAYVSATQVTCDVTVDFDAVTAIAAGEWHIATATVYVPHLAGQEVAVVTDGGVYSDGSGEVDSDFPTVTPVAASGAVVLTRNAAVIHVGLPYTGILKTQNLELGGRNGPVQNKPRNISEMFIKFLHSLGTDYGTDLYALQSIEHRDAGSDAMDRPAPVFSGVKQLKNSDGYSAKDGKYVYVAQRLPVPCVVQSIDLRFDTTEEA